MDNLRCFKIEGMRCASCASRIENALTGLPNVQKVSINFADKMLYVESDSSQIIINQVKNLGYQIELVHNNSLQDTEEPNIVAIDYLKKSCLALVAGVLFFLWVMLNNNAIPIASIGSYYWFFWALITLVVALYSGFTIFKSAYHASKRKSMNMDFLITLGVCIAWFYSMLVLLFPNWFPIERHTVYFESVLFILAAVNFGRYLEEKAKKKAYQAIKKLINLVPKQALRYKNNQTEWVDLDQLVVGDIIAIRPGERVAIDACITKGVSYIDESMLTGESLPIKKEINDTVYAGTLNQDGYLSAKVLKDSSNTVLASIVQQIRQASAAKLPITKLADKISAVFIPSVVMVALFSALIWLWLGPIPSWPYSIIIFSTVLIVACPCALGLATPISLVISLTKAAQLGAIVRQGDALQTACDIDCVAIDKTGTLTLGQPTLFNIDCDPAIQSETALSYVASLELMSEHPLGKAIVDYAREHNVEFTTVEHFNYEVGSGIMGVINSQQFYVGSAVWLKSLNIKFSLEHEEKIAKITSKGNTIIGLANAEKVLAIFEIADPIREESATFINYLKQRNIAVVMLTGDDPRTAATVASQLTITQFKANLKPLDKIEQLKQLQKKYTKVAMVGDGINDAAAMMQADVSFAMGKSADVTIATTDVVLMSDSLLTICNIFALSKCTLKNIKQNLFGAFIYNGAAIPLAAGVMYPFTGHLLNPAIAGLAMALSSVTVIVNALRLKAFKPLK